MANKLTTEDLRKFVPGYCETITTKEVASSLGITTARAKSYAKQRRKRAGLLNSDT